MAKKKTDTKPTIKEKLDAVQEATQPDMLKAGSVTGAVRLNVRSAPRPNAPVAEIIALNDLVQVKTDETHKDFYAVITNSGIEGYCMKKYIKLKK